ncbi:hypothetical protein [Mucilaginibacter phyllosphaerae]|uniref:Uncharacterized protein n=1 Tax=Mucilaginibacter phyllosphaerae TaxID=1812349 RepID=A0A4Y8AD50_9SPHI|nr:hypothetical protein [Mucilaginibacter phyllosphaerae]MBB3970153.1 hypothetical protein [Mucilaginibacter phyllosphaerae]TEW66538.1 hypothetical protein E2R65_08930 [Mucilaginibacter phyllosphaerae]GGH10140.1 hypothetical protein GCM10007352_15820 [Mucilaginibacter phyllosphaerae]
MMKKLFITIFAFSVLSLSACTGNNKTGGDQADSGATNVGSSGAADTTVSSSAPAQTGTSGTDTSANGKGTANPTTDTLKSNPK